MDCGRVAVHQTCLVDAGGGYEGDVVFSAASTRLDLTCAVSCCHEASWDTSDCGRL